MTTMDLLFLLVLVLLRVRAVRALLVGQRVELRMTVPGKPISDALLVLIFGLAVFLRRAALSYPLLLVGGLLLTIALSMFAKSGLSANGLIHNGKTVPLSGIEGVIWERETEKDIFVRFRAGNREYGFSFPPEQKEQFLARVEAAKLPVARMDEKKP